MSRHSNYYEEPQHYCCARCCWVSSGVIILLTFGFTFLMCFLLFNNNVAPFKRINTNYSNDAITFEPTVFPVANCSTSTTSAPIYTVSDGTSRTTRPLTPPLPAACPELLPEPVQNTNIFVITDLTSPTAYTRYSTSYRTPYNVQSAMLIFDFTTQDGKWHLDNVFMRNRFNYTFNYISNGGFETGNLSPHWKYCHVTQSWFQGEVMDTNTYRGNYSFATGDFGLNSRDYLTQVLSVEPSTDYTIEFYLLATGQVTSASVAIDVN